MEFHQFHLDLGTKVHNLSSDTFKLALLTPSVTPTASDANPHFGGTGSTNYATNEVTPGGNYTSGGVTLSGVTYTSSGGIASLNATKVSIALNASNPNNARWAVIYNDTDANKRAVSFIDLSSIRDLSSGLFEIRFNSVDGNGTILTVS